MEYKLSENILNKLLNTYSLMQLDGNSFGGDVVLESVDMASRDGDNILDQIFFEVYDEDFKF